MKKEIPILYSTQMVQSILEDRKTKTRRTAGLDEINKTPDDWQFEWADFCLKKPWRFTKKSSLNEKSLADRTFYQAECKCPYGKPGDLLWVREEHYKCGVWVKNGLTKTGKQKWSFRSTGPQVLFYNSKPTLFYKSRSKEYPEKAAWYKRLGRFMKKSDSRLMLEVTDVRVERLREISNDDAMAEGIEWIIKFPEESPDMKYYRDYGFLNRFAAGTMFKAKNSFFTLWEKINGRESLQANPWVWVISFRVLSKTGKP